MADTPRAEEHPLAGTLIGAMMNVHWDSPLQKSYDPAVLDKYMAHAATFEEGVRQGGITVRPEPGKKPLTVGDKEWYGVGGSKNPNTDEREPEHAIDINPNVNKVQFNTHHALGHILRAEGYNLDRKAGRTPNGKVWPAGFAGGWNETPSEGDEAGQPMAVLDYSSVFRGRRGRDAAVKSAHERGERAVFDAKNIDEIDVPSAMEEIKSRGSS